MFKIDDCFKGSGIFNEILIKRFEDNFDPQNKSRLWIAPGHIVFTTNDNKIHTCDAKPYDFSSSPSEAETDELISAVAPVLNVILDSESPSTRMFVTLTNGDVQIFEYRTLLFEWARIGYFNLVIVSPNSNNQINNVICQVLISCHQNTIFWSEKCGDSETSFDLHKREIPLNGVREITQSAIGSPLKLFKNCPEFKLLEIRDNVCLVPKLPNNINLYIILSPRSHVWLFHIDGKVLWRGVIADSAIDFVSLCAKTVGLWNSTGILHICTLLDCVKNFIFLLNNKTLLTIASNGEIREKIDLDLNPETINECFVMNDMLCSFSNSISNLSIHSTKSGELIQTFDLKSYSPLSGMWYHSSYIPSLGFCSGNLIYHLAYTSLSSLLASEQPCHLKNNRLLKQDSFHVFSLLRDIIYHGFETSDIPSLKNMPKCLQSKALLLAILQTCREKGFKSEEFPLNVNVLFSENSEFHETKLKILLDPIVECFEKLERNKIALMEGKQILQEN